MTSPNLSPAPSTDLPPDRASLDSILRFLMAAPDAYLVLNGTYRLCDLIGDLAGTAAIEANRRARAPIHREIGPCDCDACIYELDAIRANLRRVYSGVDSSGDPLPCPKCQGISFHIGACEE